MKNGIGRVFAMVVSLSLVTPSAFAVNVQQGQTYSGKIKLEFPSVGTSFVLPTGWKGGVPNGKEVFLLGNNTLGGVGVVGTKKQSAATVLQEMRSPIPFIGNTKLIPHGAVQRKGNALFGVYRVQGARVPMAAYVVSVFGNNGEVVFFLVAARQSNINRLTQDIQLMTSSVVIAQPTTPPSDGNNASSSQLGKLLNGLKLTFMKTWSTTRKKINIYLCKNGTFYYSKNFGGVSGGGTIAGRNSSQGRWTMWGTQGFTLRYNNGSIVNKRVTFQGKKLFLNGVRYFRNGSAGC